jgi:rare lipoprotein A
MVLLTACALLPKTGGYYRDDGPGDRDLRKIVDVPDAIPRNEPRSATGNKPYRVNGKTYYPLADGRGYRERGVASWYGKMFHGRRTSSGEPYDMYTMTAAHRTLPLPSYVRVRNLNNDRVVVVRVNDRGPFLHNRLIDLSYAAAGKLGIVGQGTGLVEIETVGPGTSADTVVAQDSPSHTEGRVTTYAIDSGGGSSTPPRVEIIAPAQADAEVTTAPRNPAPPPRLYVQVGAFSQWDNAIQLRSRLERAAFRPIFIESTLLPARETARPQDPGSGVQDHRRVYRVRIGPLTNVAEGDRLTTELARHGISNAQIVVE